MFNFGLMWYLNLIRDWTEMVSFLNDRSDALLLLHEVAGSRQSPSTAVCAWCVLLRGHPAEVDQAGCLGLAEWWMFFLHGVKGYLVHYPISCRDIFDRSADVSLITVDHEKASVSRKGQRLFNLMCSFFVVEIGTLPMPLIYPKGCSLCILLHFNKYKSTFALLYCYLLWYRFVYA